MNHHAIGAYCVSVQGTGARHSLNPFGRLGPVSSAVIFLLGTCSLLTWFVYIGAGKVLWYPIYFLFSGKVFARRGMPFVGALDQSGLLKGYFLFFLFSLHVGAMVFVLRWFCDRQRKAVRVVICTFGFALFLHPLVILLITSYDLLRYIAVLGFTLRRMEAVLVSLAGFAAGIGFNLWASGMWRPSLRRLIRRLRPLPPGYCPNCRYDLRGTPHHCPECGWHEPTVADESG